MSAALIGPVVGPVSARPTGTTSLTDSGQGFDFAIGGLGFKIAASDKRPYERATAQFKKDQFDSAPTPGEQGLTGWWLRSQLSFHKGAGLKYYEVLDGETILNRYQASEGINPSTAGKVVLEPALGDVLSADPTNVKCAAPTVSGVAFIDGSTVKSTIIGTGTATSVAMAGGETPIALAASGDKVYVATTARKVQKFSVFAPVASVVYTHTVDIVDLWWEKQRLWILDTSGDLYAVSGSPPAPPEALASPVATLPNNSGLVQGDACLTASGSALYATVSTNAVYRLAVDADGTVPTLAGPAVTAELPVGEEIYALRYYLGALVLSTSAGLRAAIESDGGITYGPLLVNTSGAKASTIAVGGNSAYVVASPPDAGDATQGQVVYAIDLSQPIGADVAFAWRVSRVLTTDSTHSKFGAFELYGTVRVFWMSGKMYTDYHPYSVGVPTGDLTPGGEITTGYHRFGTLEPKKFVNVKVRVGGTGGSIKVSRVMADGSVVDIYTIDPTTTLGDEIDLGLATTEERLGLKFTLARDAVDPAKGPELLGYQLRALPAPRRQRMIRVPLEVFDVERGNGPRTTGRHGSAWERLSALEDMETTGGTFQFQDFRTGEAGECFIESIEHQGMTPPGRVSDGFGGIVFLTLRKL